MTPQNIRQIIDEKSPAEALTDLDEALLIAEDPKNKSELLAEKGKLLWKLERRGDAMTAYQEGMKLDPDGPCSTLLEMSQSIMAFFNKDLLNP